MSLFRNRRSVSCPFCFRALDLESCPVVAQNFGQAVPSGAPTSADAYAAMSSPLDSDAVYASAPAPTADATAPISSRPASGAAAVGQIGPFPVLFDPEAQTSGSGGIGSLLGGERTRFDPVDRPAKLCRSCEMPLPENLGSIDVFTIALVGTQYSGKTHYLTAVGYELLRRQRLYSLGLGRVRPVGSTSIDFHERRYLAVYEQKLAHGRTTAAEGFEAARKPFAMELQRPDGRTTMVLIHDVPGEWLMDANRRAGHFQFLNHADGVIFLIDPLALPEVRRRLEGRVDPVHFGGARWNQDRLIYEMADQLGSRASSLPTSVVISKADMVERAYGAIPELARPESSTIADLDRDISELHAAIRGRILPWLDEPAIAAAAESFPAAVYHLVAALGTLPEVGVDASGNSVQRIVGEIKSRRVLDPFYRVLAGR